MEQKQTEGFQYSYSVKQQEEIKRIRSKYEAHRKIKWRICAGWTRVQ